MEFDEWYESSDEVLSLRGRDLAHSAWLAGNNSKKVTEVNYNDLTKFKYVFCGNCKQVTEMDIRPNSDECSDLCCNDCHFVVATLFT